MQSLEQSQPKLPDNPFGLTRDDVVGFIFAHPDDELKVAHALNQLAALSAAGQLEGVVVQYLTDGEATTIGDPEYVLNKGRRKEAIASIGSFGIAASVIDFAGRPDSELPTDPDLPKTAESFLERKGITVAVTLGPDHKHPDHEAVHDVVLKTRNPDTSVWGLNHERKGTGDAVFRGQLSVKLGVMADNFSQFEVYRNEHDWPKEWEGQLPAGWQLVDGYAVSPYALSVLDDFAPILHKETYDFYPPN